ncbi:MAG: hypothetical protein V3V28_09405 [Polaribacter sp.]|uniref:hypothetical protein n=1 Tax=Polaribacter sp. TaxID=1920175 RepID=UPI002F359C07
MIIISKFLVRKGYAGMAIFPLIILRNKKNKTNKRLINHERIHLKQQLELLIIPFFIWYGIEFLINWVKYKNSKTAYYNISFEREAYQNEYNLKYLKTRKLFSFLKY